MVGNDGRLRRALFPVAAILAFAAFACGPWSGAFADGPIKIGLLLTYVGPTSIFARYEDKGARCSLNRQTKAAASVGDKLSSSTTIPKESRIERARFIVAWRKKTTLPRSLGLTAFLSCSACPTFRRI